uniref:Uncharacterized protein n=1 Tax=Salix viminalis TaxID=40686 RepID=A0A6N2NHC9_SALVM
MRRSAKLHVVAGLII